MCECVNTVFYVSHKIDVRRSLPFLFFFVFGYYYGTLYSSNSSSSNSYSLQCVLRVCFHSIHTIIFYGIKWWKCVKPIYTYTHITLFYCSFCNMRTTNTHKYITGSMCVYFFFISFVQHSLNSVVSAAAVAICIAIHTYTQCVKCSMYKMEISKWEH